MNKFYRKIEFFIARIMFILTIIFLALAAILIQYLQVDDGLDFLPRHQEMIDVLLILWCLFFLERLIYLIICPKKNYLAQLCTVLLPPLRLQARHCEGQKYILWDFTWYAADEATSKHIEKRFLYPILICSIVLIPFWIAEIFFPQGWGKHPILFHIINMGNALIWGLFVIEFIIMFSLTKKRSQYVIKHWLEIFIILLPMLALARFLLISKYFYLSKHAYWFVKLQKILNIYRARTVVTRIIRIFIIIDVVKRLYWMKNPEKYLSVLQEQLLEKEAEVADLKKQISDISELIKN
ncbi:MAG: hypothetical protein KAH77_05670 [Thiomargarita sp.]|nr:hypothetical protein [Thiomargarita sp.]